MSFEDVADRVAKRNKPQPMSVRGALIEAIVQPEYVPPARRSNALGFVLLYLGIILTICAITGFVVFGPGDHFRLGLFIIAIPIAIAAKGARIVQENQR